MKALSSAREAFENNMQDLKETLQSINEDLINVQPFEGSWTAGQDVEHIIKSAHGILEVINGKVIESTRAVDEKVSVLESIFLDYNSKMNAPDFVVPSNDVHQRSKLLESIDEIVTRYIQMLSSVDLSKTCTDFQLPNLGQLTRLEWVWFVIYHTQRHTHQLKNIGRRLFVS